MKLRRINESIAKQYVIGYYTSRMGVKTWTGNLTKEDLSDLHSLFLSIFYDVSQMDRFEEDEYLTEVNYAIKNEDYSIKIYRKESIE
jgi:hypothetical protein